MPTRADDHERAFRSRLEAELIERHGSLYGGRATASGRRRAVALVAAVLLVAAAVGAAPAHRTLEVGHLVTIEMPAGARTPAQSDLLVHLLDARTGAEQASVSVNSSPVRGDDVLLLVFGSGILPGALHADLVRAFPELAAGRWRIRELKADVQTSLARALGERVHVIPLDAELVGSRRRLVIDRLATGGWQGEVTFEKSDGIRSLEVRIDGK